MAKKKQKGGETLDRSTSQERPAAAKAEGDQKKPKIFFSPKGASKYAWLFKPDTRFVKADEDGKYKITLMLDPKDAEAVAFLASIKKETGKGKVPYKKDEESGLIAVKFKTEYPPQVVDGMKQKIASSVMLGNGSIVRVAFTFNHYAGFGGGVNLYLRGVQVLKLVEYQPDVGFDADPEGYQADQPPAGDDSSGGDDLPY